jgi:hypothetical protein
MTAKMMRHTRLSEEVLGFRIGPNGEVEVMTEAEAEAMIRRAIREAMHRAAWPRSNRKLH